MTEPQPSAPSYVTVPATTVMGDPRRKWPLFASFLSMMPGLGQIYVGYYQRGFIHAIVVGALIAFLAAAHIEALIPLAAMFLAFFWLYNIVDAGRLALLYNEALAGRAGVELPEDFKTPGLSGSIAGGLAIVAVGAVLLSHTLFGVSLEWVNDWWPAAVIAFGVYLVARSVITRSGAKAAR
jgi:TM2 domain-containing membrane protein YozV